MLKKTVVIILTLMISFMLFIMPVSAATEQMSFNLWSTYQNAIHIGFDYYDEYGSLMWQFCRSLDNSVNLSADNLTIIENNEFIKPDSDQYNFINNIQISVPTDKLKPAFYVGSNYLNKEIYFTVQVNVKIYNGIFNTGSAIYPTATIYMGENADNYKQISCKIATFEYNFTDDTLFCKYDCKVTFNSTGFICGFWFNVGNDTGSPKGFGIHLKNSSEQPYFRATYTLSPLLFSDDITASDIGESVGEAIKEQQENEKQEANNTGNSAVDSVTGAIPSDTTGFLNAIKLLTSSMSYDGTDAIWTIPSMKIPKMDGITEEIKLTDKLQVNFADYVNMIPANVLSVARIVCTLALIVFCAKELYGLIQEVMVSRRSGSNE